VSVKRGCSLGIMMAVTSMSLVAVRANVAVAFAQTPQTAASTSQRGTVKAVTGTSLSITTDAGQQLAITVGDRTRVMQVAPGSTDLKAAQVITLTDVGVGDKVLVTGKAGDTADSFTASRVILMKSGDIAQKHGAEQADWQSRGMGGIVNAVDPSTGQLTISSGAKKTQVVTTGTTIFRRYAGDSIKFEDAKPGTVAQIQAGDQLEVRGAKSEDGTSIQAEEVVSGSFRNLSGTLATVNASAGTVTLRDLTTKKMVTVSVTANSDLRKLPPEIAQRFAARQRGAASGATATGQTAGAHPSAAAPPPPAGTEAGGRPGGSGRSAGMDLSKLLTRLPSTTLADLHVSDAVMIVASQSQQGSDTVTAVTMLSGVEPILAATPTGSPAVTLSPWQVGGGSPEGGGAPQ